MPKLLNASFQFSDGSSVAFEAKDKGEWITRIVRPDVPEIEERRIVSKQRDRIWPCESHALRLIKEGKE